MAPFAEELKKSRRAAGFKTASSFFEWLKAKGISFNYSYYMRMEQGSLPSEKVVAELASTVKKDWAERLILAYCRSLFPRHSYLFSTVEPARVVPDEVAPREDPPAPTDTQKELTLRQVAAIAQDEDTYHLFLLSTLARRAVRTSEVDRWFTAKALHESLKALADAGLVSLGKGAFEHTAVELRFPEAYNAQLKEAYAKLDSWDDSFGRKYGLEQILNKMIVRRVSGRYLSVVRKHLEVLFELAKTSDEVDRRYNENVLQLRVSLRQGKLPG